MRQWLRERREMTSSGRPTHVVARLAGGFQVGVSHQALQRGQEKVKFPLMLNNPKIFHSNEKL